MYRKAYLWIEVLINLGISNLFKIFIYRLKLKSGYLRFKTPKTLFISGDFFSSVSVDIDLPENLVKKLIKQSDQLKKGYHPLFHGKDIYVGSPPNWFQNGEKISNNQHWSVTQINTTINKDIKKTWDLSRFQWAPIFAATYLSTNNQDYLRTLNTWISDWRTNNPANTGVNWVCAQEASIRMLNILNTLYILGQKNASSPLFVSFIQTHCQRIASSLQYSIAQANNHGVSEATALFIGGNWLARNALTKKEKNQGTHYANLGLKKLELLVSTLIADDGSFSMYSLNYHRAVLDTLSCAEFWRKQLALKKFSTSFYKRASSMVDFLFAFIDEKTGDVPNIGTNDGSYSFHLNLCEYRDYRPSVQVGAYFFQQSPLFSDNYCNCLIWMGASPANKKFTHPFRLSKLFSSSGFAILIPNKNKQTSGIIRFPRYKFRPAHSDQLHFDLWYKGENILRDSGTFSYNTSHDIETFFQGTKGHNTVQFDDQEPMPKLSRFLVGDWLTTSFYSPILYWIKNQEWEAAYKIKNDSYHKRHIKYHNNTWIITDYLSGNYKKAILRWHLLPKNWIKNNQQFCIDNISIAITANVEIKRTEINNAFTSLFYANKEETPVLEVEILSTPAILTTKVRLK